MRRTRTSIAAIALVAALGPSCYSAGGRGKPPIDNQIYFPVGVALTPKGSATASRFLIVANSDFDLNYNSGTIQALDLNAIANDAMACESGSASCPADETFGAGVWNAAKYVTASVRIGAFASDLKVVDQYETATTKLVDRSRILVPVRGDATLTYVDVFEDPSDPTRVKLDCYAGAGFNELGHDCDANYRVGQVPTTDARHLTLEGEPFAIALPDYWPCAAGSDLCDQEPSKSLGLAAIVHQSSGDVSVLKGVQSKDAPTLLYTLGGLPVGATAIAALDITDGVSASTPFVPRFLVTNNSQASMTLVSYLGDGGNPDRSALVASSAIPLSLQATGYDTRGVVVDPPGQGESRPTRVFVTSRSPASLVVGQIDPASGDLHFYENHPLPIGPSRIVRSSTIDASGIAHSHLYIASYDSAYVVSYDPDARRFGDVIKAGRGPYSVAVDTDRELAYVANFIDGTIQVLDLSTKTRDANDPFNKAQKTSVPNANFEQIVFTVGLPQGPRP